MTANQIKYAEHKENARHNVVMEGEEKSRTQSQALTSQANWWQAATASARLEEDSRHNRRSEFFTQQQLSETYRSNLANESIKLKQHQESVRHNQASEEVDWFKANTQDRYNQAMLKINQLGAEAQMRAAQAREASALASSMQADAALKRLAVEEKNSAIRYAELLESQRANKAREVENTRHNKASESLGYYDVTRQTGLGYSRLSEDIRHNMANELVSNINAQANMRNAYTNRLNARTKQGELNVSRRNAESREREVAAREFESKIKASDSIFRGLSGLAAFMG